MLCEGLSGSAASGAPTLAGLGWGGAAQCSHHTVHELYRTHHFVIVADLMMRWSVIVSAMSQDHN
jgi:hypothetical protein